MSADEHARETAQQQGKTKSSYYRDFTRHTPHGSREPNWATTTTPIGLRDKRALESQCPLLISLSFSPDTYEIIECSTNHLGDVAVLADVQRRQ